MGNLQLKKLESIIQYLEDNKKFTNNNQSFIDLYNSFVGLYSTIDVILDMYSYDIKTIPEEKKISYNFSILSLINKEKRNYNLMKEHGIKKEILEDCKKLFS